MAIKKSELYSSLWASCDALRGGMDASQYKDYVLVLLFIKYVSDKYAGRPDAVIEVPAGASFADMVKLIGDKEIGDRINKRIIAPLAEANDLKGVIDVADFNDEDRLGKGKEMVERLSKLIAIFNRPELDFSANRAGDDDLLGDAYEFLMQHFSRESGKSKGQFYTPAEVSQVIARVIDVRSASSAIQTLYDPTCGSGSLLLKAHDEAPVDLSIYGQDKDIATTALARMNMILHGCPSAEIAPGGSSTLVAPFFREADARLKTFDFVVANPPFSYKEWSLGLNPEADPFERFSDGVPPRKNGDFAFLLHLLKSMKPTGKGAVILPHGVLFRGNAEATIRRRLIHRGYLKGIIGLPPNLFYGTGIPACIIVLDKAGAVGRRGIFMIDASRGYLKDGNKNRLRQQDIHKIVDVFTRQLELPGYSRLVSFDEIDRNDCNLNLPRYIDTSEPEDLQDIDAHLNGGIPARDIDALARYWQECPALRDELFAAGDRPGYLRLLPPVSALRQTILDHPQFGAFRAQVTEAFGRWTERMRPFLLGIGAQTRPKELIERIADDLLDRFRRVPLLDAYDVYQHLMDYWAQTMQDDVYMLVADGWQPLVNDQPNTDLIPVALVEARWFAEEARAIDDLEAEREVAARALEEYEEEHGGEDGPLEEARTDRGKLTAKSVKDRLAGIRRDPEAEEERTALQGWLALSEAEAAAAKRMKAARKALDEQIAARYRVLTRADVQSLVIDDKWLATLDADVHTELDRISQALTERVRQLAERYAVPLPVLTDEVATLSARVDEHLKAMGFAIHG